MKETQWVQHISGQGEKWEVLKLTLGGDDGSEWHVRSKNNFRSSYALPKSEYRLCEPPEVWEDVTKHIEPSPVSGNWRNVQNGDTVLGVSEPDYHIRKVSVFAFARPIIDPAQREMCAFVVEKRKA